MPLATVNSRYNRNVANNDGSAVDSFSVEMPAGSYPTLHALVATRDTDSYLYRISYHMIMYGHLTMEDIIP